MGLAEHEDIGMVMKARSFTWRSGGGPGALEVSPEVSRVQMCHLGKHLKSCQFEPSALAVTPTWGVG
jgi:hypothetical protein